MLRLTKASKCHHDRQDRRPKHLILLGLGDGRPANVAQRIKCHVFEIVALVLNQTLSTRNPKLGLKHWELIYQVAGKFGAHADSDHKIFLSFMSPHDAGINLGILVPQFRSYGDMALEVSKQMIFSAQPS